MATDSNDHDNTNVKILVGVTGGPQSQDALALAQTLADSLGAEILVCHVYAQAYNYPSQAHVDAEWRAFLVEQASEVIEWAQSELGGRPAEFMTYANRSSGVGLAEAAAEQSADIVVIGSAPGGAEGRITGGSTSDQLLHGSPVPVALAPRGYRNWAPAAIHRVVVAFQRSAESEHSLRTTLKALLGAGIDVERALQLITLAESVPKRVMQKFERDQATSVIDHLTSQAQETLDYGKSIAKSVCNADIDINTEVVAADTVVRALARFDWQDDDVLVIGSTDSGPIRRVFLGDMTYKLVRSATVPVVVIPRSGRS